MWMRTFGLVFALLGAGMAQDRAVEDLSRKYLADLIRIDTTNPPGNETRVAQYLKQVADAEGIPCDVLGDDPARMNFVARLAGAGRNRPMMLMAHSDVVPADRSQWTVDPFSAEVRDGFIYGRGSQDDKSLLAAELAVMVRLKRDRVPLGRDVILMSEADEESGSLGMQWLIAHAWEKIDAEFALNEGGFSMNTPGGRRVFQIQTSEKIPTRIILTARGTAGHGSLPRADNPVVHLARAVARLAEYDEPVRLNTTTRRYFEEMSKLPEYGWLAPLLPQLSNPQTAGTAANQIRTRDAELGVQLRASVSPTMLAAGMKINVIPNSAEAQIDVRRLPDETREEITVRFRRIIQDPAVEIASAPGQEMPATEPSGIGTPAYKIMQEVLAKSFPGAVVVPYMQRGATDGSWLRQKGMAVYGVPVFLREGESRAHANDERIGIASFTSGAPILWDIVLAAVH